MIIVIRTQADGVTPMIWLDSTDRLYHDASNGVDQPRPLTPREEQMFDQLAWSDTAELVLQIRSAIWALGGQRQSASDDMAVATDRASAASAQRTEWLATQTTIAGLTPGLNQATLNRLRDELAAAAGRDALLAQAVKDLYDWRSTQADARFASLADALSRAGRLLVRILTGRLPGEDGDG